MTQEEMLNIRNIAGSDRVKQEEALKKLREPFDKSQINLLPKPLSREAKKGKCNECGGWHGLPAIHLEYVGHAHLTDRLLDVDPFWSWEPLALTTNPDSDAGLPVFDSANGGLWIRLTICGMTRIGYGHAGDKEGGDAIKECIGDAIRNAAMRFGCALDLWKKEQPHQNTNGKGNGKGSEHTKAEPSTEKPEKKEPKSQEVKYISKAQVGRLNGIIASEAERLLGTDLTNEQRHSVFSAAKAVRKVLGYEKWEDVPASQYEVVCEAVKGFIEKEFTEPGSQDPDDLSDDPIPVKD